MKKKPAFSAKDRKPKQPRKITRQYLENAALYYLQRYASSSGNFRAVMTRKVKRSCLFHKVEMEPFLPMIEDLIARYEKTGLLNDKVFAEAKVASLRRQGRSKRAIQAKLQAKGLPTDEIDAALTHIDSSHEDGTAEMAAAQAFIKRKKLGRYRKTPIVDIKDKQKELAAMGRAGFSFEVARAALEYAGEDEEF